MNLTIVGLGSVGTSLGLALKAVSSDIAVTGHDPDASRVQQARKRGAIDKSHWNLVAACEDADLIVLDLSLEEIEKTLAAVGDHLKPGALVVDTAPIKRPVLDITRRLLPSHVHFVGGHVVSATPVEGDEASAGWLGGACFFLVPAEGADPEALRMASNLAAAVGATPCFIDAEEHDGVVAGTSHLPMASALAVASVLGAEAGLRERARAAGPEIAVLGALLDRLDSASPNVLLANADNLVHWLDALIGELGALRDEIAGGDGSAIAQRLSDARERVGSWLSREAPDQAPSSQLESPWRAMLVGGLVGRRRRDK